MSAPYVNEFGPHSAMELHALESAHRILASLMDHGPVGPLSDAGVLMPSAQLSEACKIAVDAWNEGRRGYAEILGYLLDTRKGVPDVKLALDEAVDGRLITERPEALFKAVETLREFQFKRRQWVLAHKLVGALQGNGDDPREVVREIEELNNGSASSLHDSFPITLAGEMGDVSEPLDFVEGLLTEGGASVVYGPSNCGKSFWILDLAASVATGEPFRDELEVDQGAVVYVALEGERGAKNRILAMQREGRLAKNAPLYLCFAPVSLLEPGHAEKLAATVKDAAAQSGVPCRLVILDTMARAMAGGDENSGQDMTLATKAIDAVRAATGAHVCVVHHCGKDEAKGARGHSSLKAAVDTEIEVFRPPGLSISTVKATKQRDLTMGEPMPFSLKVVELDTDRRGNPITSCVVRHEDAVMAAAKAKAGRKPVSNPDEILKLLPQPTTAAWRTKAQDEAGVSPSTFDRMRREIQGKLAFKGADGGWSAGGVSK